MAAEPGWILVVDDDPTDRMQVFRLLERAGYNATVADNGAAALDLLRAEPFEVVLLGLPAEEPEGSTTLQAIKQDRRFRDILVLVVCPSGDHRAAVRAIELGADDYLERPYEPVLLRTRLEAVLTRKQLKARDAEYHALRLSRTGRRRVTSR